MSRLERAFSRGKAFIPFITAGDPSMTVTEQLIYTMYEAGADLIEVGIPFSDPVAEGPVIQAADERALASGVTVDDVFAMMQRVRNKCDVPVALMTYVNPVATYGTDRFMMNCSKAGIDAVIVPDVPFEERDELLPYCRKHGITLISMIAPTSGERIRMIAAEAEGFVYCVSSLGVTGIRERIGYEAGEMIKAVKAVKDIPCAIGFGISTPEQAAELAVWGDGIIVGSAVVKIVEEYGENCVGHVAEYVRRMKAAISG
ncbi:MAG TPA: tryptophan synthase subunit alpha [Clostridiales bacterium]|nr:tryptophan synthase subunit alpha [Clostridiales bacterium]HPV00964.1 tryptophan synthase subunit alpha [Clostridiales bacterium]